MYKILKFIEQHANKVLIGVLILTIFFSYNAIKIKINADYEALLPWNEEENIYKGGISGQKVDLSKTIENELQNGDSEFDSTYFVLVKGDNIFSKESLNAIENTITSLEKFDVLSESFSIFDFVTLEKKGTRLSTVPFDFKQGELWTDDEALLFEQRVLNDPLIKYFLVGENNDSLLISFNTKDISKAELIELEKEFEELISLGLDVNINGRSVISQQVMNYLNKDLITLIILCLVIILLVYYLTFKSKRAVLVPMSLSIISLIWTFGTMALLGIEITILNIIAPCMVLVLGTSYSIHVLSEYYTMVVKKEETSPALATAHVTKTIIFASSTTICGFLALCISQVVELRLFGISVAIGLLYCAFLSCFYLPAILVKLPDLKMKKMKKQKGFNYLEKLVNFISKNVIKYWKVLLMVLLLIFIAFIFVHDKIPMNSNTMSYFPESDDFGRRSNEFAEDIGGLYPFKIQIEAPEGSSRFFLEGENLSKVRDFEEKILESNDVLQSISFSSYVAHSNYLMSGEKAIPESSALMNMLSRLIMIMKNQVGDSLSGILSDDAKSIEIVFRYWDAEEKEIMTTGSMQRILDSMVDNLDLLPEGTSVKIGGDPIASVKFEKRLMEDQEKSTFLSLIIVFIMAGLAFISISKAFVTIVPILIGIMINYIFMYLTGIPFDIITISFTSIAIGCGVDDAIHFMLRFRQNIKNITDINNVLEQTIIDTGKPIILTTISIVLGLSMLGFASYMPIRYFGLLLSVSLFGCMIATLIFIPPVMILFSRIKVKK